MPSKTKTSTRNPPDPVDINAGSILRALRSWRGISQEKLASEIGITFQQIQKYEKAKNRMAVSTLYKISRILDVSVIEFFAGLDGVWPDTKDLWLEKDEIVLLKTYRAIRDESSRAHVRKIVEAVANDRLD